jgi:ornithine--oxo-acid transaminase
MNTAMPVTPVDALDILALYEAREAERYSLASQHMNQSMAQVLRTIGYDIGFVRGEGPYLYDRAGARYLDLLSGWGVFGIGRNHPRVAKALCDVLSAQLPGMVQMDTPALAGLLAEALLRRTPFLQKVHFVNSGSEAVEAAIKIARRATRRPGVVYCEGAFHGLTLGALGLNGEAIFRDGFGPLLPGCEAVPFNDLAALERALATRQAAAFIVEPIQGHSVRVASDDYLPAASALCRKYGTLLVADEVQTGLGRTGRFLASEHWGVEPDMVLISKTLSGGFVPVAAVLARKALFDKVYDNMERAVVLGSTFAGNDLAMAAGLATLEVMETERLTENAARAGDRLIAAFKAMADRYELVADVRGKGLMIGVELGEPRSMGLKASWRLLEAANTGLFAQAITIPLLKDERILVQVAGHASHTVKLLPALTLSDDDCAWIERSFEAVIASAHRAPGPIWALGKALAGNVFRTRSPRAAVNPRAPHSSETASGSDRRASAR